MRLAEALVVLRRGVGLYAIEEDHHAVYSVAEDIISEKYTREGGTGPSAISFSMH